MVVHLKNSPSLEPTETGESITSGISKTESAVNVLNGLKKRQKSSLPNGMHSLEMLRSNVQYFFNRQIDDVMKDFMSNFFQPAIANIKENTDETISESQIHDICKSLLENAKMQYTNAALCSQTRIENETSDSDTQSQSLLHQALKRKRTEFENKNNVFKRQFLITTTSANYFNNALQATSFKPIFNSSSSLLTSALTSPQKAMNMNRPVIHLVNRNQSLKSTHTELVSLLKQNKSQQQQQQQQPLAIASEIKIEKEET